ncbi:MAG: site-specific integrase [Bacteroidota bacterium]
MEGKATAKVILDPRSVKKDGTRPLKLRVIYLSGNRNFGTGLSVLPEDWEKIAAKKARGPLKDIQTQISAIETKAQEIIDSLGAFTYNRFQDAYNGKPSYTSAEDGRKAKTVYDVFEVYIADLKAAERAGTASSYRCALVSLRKYASSLYFEDMTPAWLAQYERYMLKNGYSSTTVGIYLRCVRTIYNCAIEKGIVLATFYPFGKRKYQIPAGANIKKALTRADVQKIISYTPKYPDTWEEQARDLWLLSYLCNGMNIKDLCNLKYQNIEGKRLVFTRQKTERTTRSNAKPIVAHLPETALAIIERWGQQHKRPSSFVFPFYNMDMDAERRLAVSLQVVRNINTWMKRIGEDLGIEAPITTYTARHTFSTVLKRSGASIEFISESLGHSDMKTTENYLAGFEDDFREEMSKKLLE